MVPQFRLTMPFLEQVGLISDLLVVCHWLKILWYHLLLFELRDDDLVWRNRRIAQSRQEVHRDRQGLVLDPVPFLLLDLWLFDIKI